MQPTEMPKGLEHPQVTPHDYSRIAQDLQIRKVQVESVVQLLDEGNTVPFITRYRKERTGGLDEEVIRQVQTRVGLVRQLADRKQTILKSIETQGKLTDDLRQAILRADTSKRLEDLYLPYKPKKRTLATTARERGLEPLALAIWNRDPAVTNLDEVLPTLVNPEKELPTADDVRAGVQHILAEMVAETAAVRAYVRGVLWETGGICCAKNEKLSPEQGNEYKDYFQFRESLREIPPHRILALNRGEKENALKIHLEWNVDAVRANALGSLADSLLDQQTPPESAGGAETAPQPVGEQISPASPYRTPHASLMRAVVEDALTRLVLPSLEREIRRELTDEAEAHAVAVFGRNLRSLLLQPPIHQRRVLAIDPGFRTGCKVAALDETGNLLDHGVIYPHAPQSRKHAPAPPPAPAPMPTAATTTVETPPAPTAAPAEETAAAPAAPAAPIEAPPVADAPTTPTTEMAPPVAPVAVSVAPGPPPVTVNKRDEAKTKVRELVAKHQLNVIAIGNGTACRETEEFIAELIADALPELAYVIVNEAGASVYSASAVGREEFPDFDATLRGTISIGRRLQDPLSELVKVDPQSIGVGLYQHDVSPRHLKHSLESIIESCVNQVGVDLNTASVPLLRHVSGLNQMVARDLIEYRKQHGPFRSREQLLQVPNLGPARFTQAAGFLKIVGGDNPFDRTWIHPESYAVTGRLLGELSYGPDVIDDKNRAAEMQTKLKSLSPDELATRLELGVPTVHDILDALARPGRDPREDLPPPIFKKGILKLEDLQPGMELKGTVLNVVDFGAFVDIGLKDSGLVHISQMANRYIKNPYEVAAVGDVVKIWVLTVDRERHRVSLTMIQPGSERKPPERRPQQQERQADLPPPRERRPERPQHRQGQPQGQGQGPRRPPPRRGGPPSRTPAPSQGNEAAAPPPRPAPPPRRPRREAPRPKLSQDAIEGKVPLRTFGELSALFAAKQAPPTPPPPPPEPVAVAIETAPEPVAVAVEAPVEQTVGSETVPGE
jgi:uncharacterized protein